MTEKNIITLHQPVTGGMGAHPALGKILYVSSVVGKDSNSGRVDAPLATVVKALSKLLQSDNTQNRGDTIICMPAHTEAVPDATTFAATRPNVTILGIGDGVSQPQIQLTAATTATLTISAANVAFENMRISAAVAGVAIGITVGATDFSLRKCRMDEVGTGTWAQCIGLSAATSNICDGLSITDCFILGAAAANTYVVLFTGTTDRVVIARNYMKLNINASLALITSSSGKQLTNIQILNNQLIRLATASSTAIINLVGSTNTGMICDNRFLVAIAAIANLTNVIVAAGCGINNNYGCGLTNVSGILTPVADST